MPHPNAGYRNKAGEKVPGTTTIIGRFKESGALITWAWRRGRDGLELYDSRDKAAELGTIVHEMVELFIKGENPHPLVANIGNEVDAKQVSSAFSAFEEWFEGNGFTIIAQEVELVSEKYQHGGTLDAVARDRKDRLCLLDWKTSDGIYVDHLVQLGSYEMLWNENYCEQLTGGSHLCRFAKTHGDFAHHYFPDLSEAEEAFILMRKLYDLDKNLKKRC